MNWRDGYIAVDWGTTNRRAFSIGNDGRLIERLADDRGVLAVGRDGFEGAAAEISARFGSAPMLLAGMVGSNRGWSEAPYIDCPAGAPALAAAIHWIEPGRIGIVPGVCQRGAAGADVMRGEEVQAIGAVVAGLVAPDGMLCHPGTHAKWIRMQGGSIAGFTTSMTGEMFSLLSRHGILADQLQGEVKASASFAAGVADALGGKPLLSALFGIRARWLLGEANADASYASGLLIGSDVRASLDGGTSEIALIGAPELCALYAAALGIAGREAVPIDGETAFLAGVRQLTEIL
ncbi:MAG: 2-dehydro-3-deoxygalactonokinase [Sphingomonadales bacterium]|nr:MAG: 2-dehydro-3-deoxygalactonokinase [Sphingomonadales bacterium]